MVTVYDLFHAYGFSIQIFRFYFYSNEGIPREPTHVHARGQGGDAKLWLKPEVRVASSVGLDAFILRQIVEIATRNIDLIERTWDEHFS